MQILADLADLANAKSAKMAKILFGHGQFPIAFWPLILAIGRWLISQFGQSAKKSLGRGQFPTLGYGTAPHDVSLSISPSTGSRKIKHSSADSSH